MKTPHTPLRSPDLSLPCANSPCHAPKDGESPFISKGRRTWHDGDIKEYLAPKKTSFKSIEKARAKHKKVQPISLTKTEVKGKVLADGSFQMPTRKNGKFGKPIVFSASLMAKLV